ncbi:MAG: hypothetical protein M9896_19350 [Candidatus Promineofilum sp.]|uniref:sigma factor n=1 Tax=Promineifilum sp. TaxID=2664178 RepID=UPI002411D38D|nr:hypothetical protein [Promineifilum sp.]
MPSAPAHFKRSSLSLGIHADHELIDDLVQEAYLGWHRHGHKAADDPISAWTYACRVARSAALHYLRSESRQRQMAGLLVERQRLGRCYSVAG